MKILMLTLLAAYSLISCGKDGSLENPIVDSTTDQQISVAQYANLPRPCLSDASFMQLPSSLQIESNYSQYEYTQAIVEGVSTFKLHVAELSNVIFPPSTVKIAPVDDIKVFDGDEAYYWLSGDNKYLYRKKDDGYSIFYYRMPTSITAAESIYVDQNIECTSFDYIDYVVGDSPNVGKGQLRISYDLAGTAHIIEIETDIWEVDFLREKYRFFDDGSGEYNRHIGGSINLRVLWESNSSGMYIYFEDEIEVESGTFNF